MSLSKSESNVIVYLQKGYSNKDIASCLFVTEKTIKFHMTNIFKKYEVKSRAELMAQLTGYSKAARTVIVDELSKNKAVLPIQMKTQENKIEFIDKQFKVGKVIDQLHEMMTEVTKQEINPATVNSACNCVTRLNETINTAIQAAKFLNER